MAIRDLLTTDGRIPRSTYWKFFAFFYAFGFTLGFVFEAFSLSDDVKAIFGVIALPVILVGLIVQIKRWHDRDKSGWWVLINLVPYIGAIWSLVECGFLKGTDGRNGYGPDPVPVSSSHQGP